MIGDRNADVDIDASAVVAAYLSSEYAAAVIDSLSDAERAALEALRASGDEVRHPILQELANAGGSHASPESSHIPATLISALLETPASPGRMVTAIELCVQMGRRLTRRYQFLDFMRLVHVLVDRMPPTAAEDLAVWLERAANVQSARRRVCRVAGLGMFLAGCGILCLSARFLRR
ncbi:apoptosis inhibitor [Bovine papular stomatitis virus]